MNRLIITSAVTSEASREVEVEVELSTTTLLELRYLLFSLTDISPERIVLHHSGEVIQPNDDIDASRTLSSVNIIATSKLSYSDADNPLPATAQQKQGLDLAEIQRTLEQCMTLATPPPISHGPTDAFLARVREYRESILQYEDNELQQKALKVLPLAELKEKARKSLERKEHATYERALTKALLHWFKNSFFTWVDAPVCWSCGNTTTLVNVMPPTPSELKFKASRTEEFGCNKCGANSRFPRYNDAAKLLETRKGRCGEWAQVFTLLARAAQLRVRGVHDWTDHVWTEVYCPTENGGSWVHADACEDVLDEPLLYEKGWKKKLTYCVATGLDCVVDVTRRYTQNFDGLKDRRTLANESLLQKGLRKLNEEALEELSESDRVEGRRRYETEVAELEGGSNESGSAVDLLGRQSGSSAWVKSRGEDGSER